MLDRGQSKLFGVLCQMSALSCKRLNATQMLLTAVDQNVVANDRAGNVGSWRYSGRNQAKSGH